MTTAGWVDRMRRRALSHNILSNKLLSAFTFTSAKAHFNFEAPDVVETKHPRFSAAGYSAAEPIMAPPHPQPTATVLHLLGSLYTSLAALVRLKH